jgi:DNA-binding NtrC family response regulator
MLSSIFAHSRWRFYQVQSCAEALTLLGTQTIPVVISDEDLPDAKWRDLLAQLDSLPHPPHLIVTSAFADDQLWAEALNLGAYDVLPKPLHAAEVFRIVSLAWRGWNDIHGNAEEKSGQPMLLAATCG